MSVDPTTLRAFNDDDDLVYLPPYPTPTGYDDSSLRAAIAQLQAEVDQNAQADAEEDAAALLRLEELEASLADLESRPDDDIDDEARAEIDQAQADIAELKARPTGTGTGSAFFPGRHFNSFGANDDERMRNLLAWEDSFGVTSSYPQVWFDQRFHNISVNPYLRTGRRWVGAMGPSREFGTGTVIRYTGTGPTFFVLANEKNTGYGYPANGVPRDSHYIGIEFRAGLDKYLLPRPTSDYAKFVLWYCEFRDCAFWGWKKSIDYYGTGLQVTGCTHFQAHAETPIVFRGSESQLLGDMSLADSANATFIATEQPVIDFSASKSVVDTGLVSARQKAYGMRVTGGHNSKAIGTGWDGPASNFMEGGAVRFEGSASDFALVANSFKGLVNEAIRCVSGSTQVNVSACAFKEFGFLARLDSSFSGVLLWQLNQYDNLSKAVIKAARGSQVINLDPRVKVTSLDGTLTGIRNADGTYTSARRADGTVVSF